jgi:acid phosphatase family membrane protein YuiD
MVFSKVIIPVILAGAISQGLKILLFMLKHKKKFHIKDLIVTGGMPSTHSALVVSLAVAIWLYEGFSTAFVISFVLGLLVLRDSCGVRREAGEEGKMLNKVIKAAKLRLPMEHYALGHNPLEVVVGSAIGAVTSLAIYFIL